MGSEQRSYLTGSRFCELEGPHAARASSQAAMWCVNHWNASAIIFGTSSRLRFVTSSCPAPSTVSSSVRAPMSFNAATISWIEPNHPRAVNEHRRGLKAREMCRSQLGGSLRRVERVREQQELIDETWFRRGQHRSLPPSVRMTAQKHASRSLSSHGSNCRSKSLLVTFRTATLRWPVRSQLAEREVAAKDGQPGGAERIR
jgi:hypothetical protein